VGGPCICCADGTAQFYNGDVQGSCSTAGGAAVNTTVGLEDFVTTAGQLTTAAAVAETTTTAPPSPTDPTADVESIDESIAVYAKTLCRVLNPCGDADEPLCASPETMTDEQYQECVDLGCCTYTGIPERRRK
jgi:hypothetical protein